MRTLLSTLLILALLCVGIGMAETGGEQEEEALKMWIGQTTVAVTWDDNDAVQALRELVAEEPLTIEMSMYGGFEQVGSIGATLPRNDVQTTTRAGDIVLYAGNQMVVFYGSNSWAYTHLGRVTDKTEEEMAELLSKGDVTITVAMGEQEVVNMPYRTEEIWCENGSSRIYGIAYIPETEGRAPLVIFSHELGNNHESGIRYAERLAAHGYATYVFDFCGGSAGGTQNRSDGSNSEMSVLTEASDLSAVLDTAKEWPFVDSDNIFLLGGSQGGLVTLITGCERQDELAGTMLMYPALSAKADSHADSYTSPEEVPEDVPLFGGWMHVGRNYITDLWKVDFDHLLASYRGKLLLLHGDRDSTVDVSWSEQALEIIQDCEFHVISGGGHEFYGQPFEDAMGYILSYIGQQLADAE